MHTSYDDLHVNIIASESEKIGRIVRFVPAGAAQYGSGPFGNKGGVQ